MLSFHFKIQDPEKLTNEEWAEKWQQLKWVLWFDAKRHDAKPGEKVEM